MRLVHGLAAAALIAGSPAARPGEGAVSFGGSPAAAQLRGLSQEGYEAYLPQLRAAAERAGIRASTLDRIFPTLAFSPRTIELDRAQPGGVAARRPIRHSRPIWPARSPRR